MCDIIFRGKRTDNGRWIEGYYLFVGGITYILPKGKFLSDIVEVDPATIGQYTGLTDKNRSKIFAGDILRYADGTIHRVVFERRNGRAYFGWTISDCETWDFDFDFLLKLEIIGNICDTPELLDSK